MPTLHCTVDTFQALKNRPHNVHVKYGQERAKQNDVSANLGTHPPPPRPLSKGGVLFCSRIYCKQTKEQAGWSGIVYKHMSPAAGKCRV